MVENKNTVILGILGGGQLGRMSAQAAANLGIRTVILTPEADSPASQIADETIIAAYDDEAALREFAAKVDVISYEFENIPVSTIRFLKTLKPVYPDDNLLEIAQDRLAEKTFLNKSGIPTARFAAAHSPADIADTLKAWNQSKCIIKTTRFGYDGKGQVFIKTEAQSNVSSQDKAVAPSLEVITRGWDQLKTNIVIVEEVVDFDCEISVIIARDKNGHMETYGPCLNEHANHILARTLVPAPIAPELAQQATQTAKNLAEAINLRGVMALELFVTKSGQILANEIAPRTHNSGHWSIDACAVSQFENHVRTVCGLDAAPPTRHSDCEMLNLIGDDVAGIDARYKNQDNAHVHLYGKTEIRPGRKMGHVTILKPLSNH